MGTPGAHTSGTSAAAGAADGGADADAAGDLAGDGNALVGPDQATQLAIVARRFYLDGQSKQDIAREFGMTRFKVARLLEQARERGVVRIEIAAPPLLDVQLAERLAAAYGLRRAIVLAVSHCPEPELRRHLAAVTADLLSEIVTGSDVLGVGYGRTLNDTTAALTRLARCSTVQLAGALPGVPINHNSIELVRRVAAVSGGPVYPIYSPQVLPDPRTARILREQPQAAEAHRRFNEITKAVVAVGSWRPPHSLLHDALPAADREQLLALGAAAEVCSVLLDSDGNQIAPQFTRRCLSISSDQLRAIDEVIAVAGGNHKHTAIRAALLGGYATSLITDQAVAHQLLSHTPTTTATSGPGRSTANPATGSAPRPTEHCQDTSRPGAATSTASRPQVWPRRLE